MRDNMLTFQDICAEIEAESSSEEVKAILRRVANAANVEMLSEKERAAYDYALKRYRDYYSGLKTAEEKGFDKGHQKGFDQGMKEGREEGRQEGRQEGRREATLAIAKAMKGQGIPTEQIVQLTSLSAEIVNDL